MYDLFLTKESRLLPCERCSVLPQNVSKLAVALLSDNLVL